MCRSKFLWTIALCSLAAGCAALYSNPLPAEGVPYFLPQTLVRYTVNQGNPAASKIDAIDVPDKSRPRYLSYRANGFSDENVCISRTDEGLLKAVYFGAQDRTADIILNIVQLFAEAGPVTPVIAPSSEAAGGPCSRTVVSEWMDPYDKIALERFNRRLCKVRVEAPAELDFTKGITDCPLDAVCFATKSKFNAYLVEPDGKVALPFDQKTVASKRDVGWLKVRGAFFNKRITQLDFQNGVLTTMRVKKDSEIAGLSQLPLNVVERVLSVPGNAIGMAFAGYQEKLVYLQRRKALRDAAGGVVPTPVPTDPSISTDVRSCASG